METSFSDWHGSPAMTDLELDLRTCPVTCLMSPAEVVEKLVALSLPPYLHTSRYVGILSSHSKWCREIVPAHSWSPSLASALNPLAGVMTKVQWLLGADWFDLAKIDSTGWYDG